MLNFEQLKQKCFENPPRHPVYKDRVPYIEKCNDIEELRKMALSWCWSVYHQEDMKYEMYQQLRDSGIWPDYSNEPI